MTKQALAGFLILFTHWGLTLGLVLAEPLPETYRLFPAEPEIRSFIEERMREKEIPGIVAGILDRTGSQIIASGAFSRTDTRPVDGRTIFEIGSITKVFTGILLADMVRRGELNLDDPIASRLPSELKVPSRNSKPITLGHLADHTSGLPRMPGNFSPADPWNPYADYTVERMYAFLAICEPARDPGEQYEYSNLGLGLLGHILAMKSGKSFEALVRERICKPLEMTSTCLVFPNSLRNRVATGHNRNGAAVKNWDIPTLAGAGGLRSSVEDMLKFAAANLAATDPALFEAIEASHRSRASTGARHTRVGLGWHVQTAHAPDILWHNGETGGYRSFLGLDKANGRAVVILSNSAHPLDDIGFHLLDSRYPVARQKKPATADAESVKAAQ
jgi:serine-type D-Ala-D-Ala carboxypeptidase/endopeptidase